MSRAHVFVLFALTACGDNLDLYDGFTPAEWEVIESLSPLPPPPPDNTNRVADNAAAATLGQALFFEERLSGAVLMEYPAEDGGLGTVGELHKYPCTSCHDPAGAFVDTRSQPRNTSFGPNTRLARNTVTVTNAVYYKWSAWNGFIDTFWGHSILGLEAGGANNGDRLRTAHVLWDHYRDEYNAIFDPDLDPALDASAPDAARFPAFGKPKSAMAPDGPYEMMTPEDQQHVTVAMVNAAKAMGAYQRLLVRRESPFDRYVAGERTAISESAKRGIGLFIGKAGCVKCHEGPTFSDDKFHNIGVPQEGEFVPPVENETGRVAGITRITGANKVWSSAGPHTDSFAPDSEVNSLTATDQDLGAFRTQGLRNTADTGPWMHTGNFTTLRDVVVFYNEGGKEAGFQGTKDALMVKLDLSDAEIDDLVAFLESLNGDPLPDALTQDTSKP